MSIIRIALCGLILVASGGMPAAAVQSDATVSALNDLWRERVGHPVPPHVAAAFDELATQMTPADVAALHGAGAIDTARVWGDVWTVCMSRSGGCDVVDSSGTAAPQCEHVPVKDSMWLYATVPAILEVSAVRDAKGTWTAFTLDLKGTFTHGTIRGTSCIVFDDPDLTVVRSNGVVDYEF